MLSFQVKKTTQTRTTGEDGAVLSQSPRGEALAKPNSVVRIVISAPAATGTFTNAESLERVGGCRRHFADPGFVTETVATVPPYTLVGLAFAPDGRMFVWQKNGVVRIIKNGVLLPTPFIDLSAKVNTFDDRGFWGLAFDPELRHATASST